MDSSTHTPNLTWHEKAEGEEAVAVPNRIVVGKIIPFGLAPKTTWGLWPTGTQNPQVAL